MYAVVRSGNKQFRVEPGVQLLVEKLEKAEAGKSFAITDVLMVGDGEKIQVGKPLLKASVHCTCIGDELGEKKHTVKYKHRKTYKRKYGHRQEYTRLQVDRIEV